MRNRAGLETQQRILDVARELLAEKGLEGVTINAICRGAHIRAGSFYNLFESKEQVVLGIIRDALLAIDPDPRGGRSESLADLVAAYVGFVQEQRQLARVYFLVALSGGMADPKIGARVIRHHDERLTRFTAALLRERPQLDPAAARRGMEALIAALNGFALQTLIDPSFDLPAHVDNLMGLEAELTR